jgi:hypothetical protein
MRIQVADSAWHTVHFAGPLKFETWKTSPDAYPMFWIYPRPPQRAVQVTIWRRKFEFRLAGGSWRSRS